MKNKNSVSKDVWYGVKFLIPHLLRYKKYFLIIAISMILVAVTSALSAYIFKYILNDIFISKDETKLMILPIVIILIFLTRGVARFGSSYMTSKIGIQIANNFRRLMFSRLIDLEYGQKQSITTGDIHTVVIQTVINIQVLVARILPQLIISILTIAALLGMILYTDWRLSLYAIVVAMMMIIPVKMLGKGVKRHTGNSEVMITKLSNRLSESFNNFALVKVYGKEHYEKELFEHFLKKYERSQIKLSKYNLLNSPFMELFVAFAIAIVIYVGGYYVIDGSMTAGDFFAFLVALMMLYAPVKSLTQNYSSLFMLNSYVERIEGILHLPVEKRDHKQKNMSAIHKIEFRNVSYHIGETVILDNLSFVLEDIDNVAIVGRSGAGKSSVISLIFGLAKPTSGEILLNDVSLSGYASHGYREQISYVNQDAGVFNATIQENIVYGDIFDQERYTRAKKDAQCQFIEMMDKKDLEMAGEFGNRLSGGQRQRIALARAMYRGGSLFVLDEATSALDANTEDQIQESLNSVIEKKLSIIIAHRLSTVQKCNKVMVLEAGKIVAFGSYHEISQSDAFKRNFMIEG